MDPILQVLSVAGIVVGATWAIRTKLSDIEVALRSHVESDAEKFKSMDARLSKQESRRGKRS